MRQPRELGGFAMSGDAACDVRSLSPRDARRTPRDSAPRSVARRRAWFWPPRTGDLDRAHHRREPAASSASPSAARCRTAGRRDTHRRSRSDRRSPSAARPESRSRRAAGVNDASLRRPASRSARRRAPRCRRATSPVRSDSRRAFVIVDGQVASRASIISTSSVAVEQRQSLARVEDERNARRREFASTCVLHALACRRARRCRGRCRATSSTRFSCERFIAPGWNAVIWLSSRSVMMNACAVNVSAIMRTPSVASAEIARAARGRRRRRCRASPSSRARRRARCRL